MYTKLLQSIALPKLYQKNSTTFWDDAHISSQMLKAHLDPDFEGASRKHSFIKESATWIATQAPPQQNLQLLDIGCGPGLYAEEFAIAGYRVTGIDFSKRSISYAQESAKAKDLSIQYIYQNYLDMSYENKFDFATFIYCDYGALSTEDRQLILQKVYMALKPGGKLLLDVFSMEKYKQFNEYKTWQWHEHGGFWRSYPYLLLDARIKYGENITMDQSIVVGEDEMQPYYIWNTYFTDTSLAKEYTSIGFTLTGIYGDVAGAPYTNTSETIAILLQKE